MTGPDLEGTPVFVDPSGRRARWARALFLSLGALASLYAATVGVSLFLPADALHLSVPGLGGPAPALVLGSGAGGRHHSRLAELIPTQSPDLDTASPDSTAPSATSIDPVPGVASSPAAAGSSVQVSAAPTRSAAPTSTPSGASKSPTPSSTPASSSTPAAQPTAASSASPSQHPGPSRSPSPHPHHGRT